MTLLEFFEAIEATGFATTIRESGTLFPLLESIHVMALAFVVGSIAFVDLRLLGFASRKQPVTRLIRDLLPWTWGAFGVAAVTGLSLFASTAVRYFENVPLRIKFVFMFLAGINMLVFHFVTYRDVDRWDNHEVPPASARVAGGLSILFWAVIVYFGRWIGFTL